MPARIPLIFGTATLGLEGAPSAFVTGIEKSQPFFDAFLQRGYTTLDTARIYAGGTSEEILSQAKLVDGVKVDTKIWPRQPGDHKPENLKAIFQESRKSLGSLPIDVYYLHKPDRTVPYEDTLEAINELYKEGHFKQFGLSNYAAWEVAEIVGICKRRGFVQPTVYQGAYNLIQRSNETELFPCLRKFGIKFAAYSIMAGGLLTGKHIDAPAEKGSHFDTNTVWGQIYAPKYLPLLPAIRDLKVVADKHNISLVELSYRWIIHHSKMIPEDHGAILGASSVQQLETGINHCEKGPLPEEVVQACEETWKKVQGIKQDSYFTEF